MPQEGSHSPPPLGGDGVGGVKATVTILTYNSGKTLEQCLRSVAAFDEILVLDGGSTDETLAIAERFSARVEPQAVTPGLITDFTAVRERSFVLAKHDWILWLDSDEWADEELIASIKTALQGNGSMRAFTADRVPVVNGRVIRYAYFFPDRVLRFVHRKSAHWAKGKKVHEHLVIDSGVGIEHARGVIFTPWDSVEAYRKKDRYYLALAFSKPLGRRPPMIAIVRAVMKNVAQAAKILCQAAYLSLRYGRTGAVLPWPYHVRFAAYHLSVARERVRQFFYGRSYQPPRQDAA